MEFSWIRSIFSEEAFLKFNYSMYPSDLVSKKFGNLNAYARGVPFLKVDQENVLFTEQIHLSKY